MHFEPHAALGWTIGNIAGADRKLRNYCVLGAVLPDVDAVALLFGGDAYAHFHHTFGHNIFAWALFTGWVTIRCRSWKAFLLSFICFGTHLLADAKFSLWQIQLFWPLTDWGFMFPNSISLLAPINTHLVYYSFLLVALLSLIYRRTPVDIFSPKLDQLLISFFRKKRLQCHVCGKGSNQTCSSCGGPVCFSHGAVQKNLTLLCPTCTAKALAIPEV